jgi:hypothetical protein
VSFGKKENILIIPETEIDSTNKKTAKLNIQILIAAIAPKSILILISPVPKKVWNKIIRKLISKRG